MSETSNPKHVIEALNLDIDLTKADLDYPVFPEGLVRSKIIGVKVQPNKKETGRNLVVTFASEQTLTSTKGREVPAGKANFTKYYALQPSEKNPDWDWTADIARLQLAALGQRTQGLNTSELGGRIVYLKIKIEEGKNAVDKVLAVSDVEK